MAMVMSSMPPVVAPDEYVEAVEHKVASEPGVPPPERPGNPGVHIGVIPGGNVIGDNRRTVFIVVGIDILRIIVAGWGTFISIRVARVRRSGFTPGVGTLITVSGSRGVAKILSGSRYRNR